MTAGEGTAGDADVGTVGIVGVGEIAAAIVDGLRGGEGDGPDVLLSPRGARTAADLAARHPRVTVCADNQAVVAGAATVVLAVGPDDAPDVLTALDVAPDRTVVSVVAGVDRAALLAGLAAPATGAGTAGDGATSIDAATSGERTGRPGGDVATVVRAVPLPAARRRASVTALWPDHPAARALFERVGTVVAAADEAQLAVLTAATATMSAHLGSLAVLADWLTTHGVAGDDADRYVLELFRGVAGGLGTASLADLARGHETPGGLNAQLRAACLTPAAKAALIGALDAVAARIA